MCEDELERAIPKIFHAYGSWTVVEQPTCTEYGTRQRVCLSCGGIDELDDVKPTGIHTYGNWHGLDMLYHQHVCEVCGGTEDQAHAFNDGICSVCDYELPEYTKELEFTINADKQSYSVSGVNRTGGYPTTVVIPDYYDDGINGVHPVTRINKDVFSTSGGTCLWLRSIRLPDTLEYIDSGNFWHANIDRLVIPDSVKTIVANSFRDTTMRTLEIGTGLAEIGSLVFYSSTYLEEITVSSQNNVFRSSDNCLIKGNTVVRGNKFGIIPTDSSVTEIGSQAYNYASAIEELRIPSNIKHIRSGAFESCTEISRVEIHSKIESVAATVFGGTTVIEAKIPASCVNVLPKTVEKVVINSGTEIVGSFKTGDGTEANTALKSVTIVSTVTEIPEGTFENCVNLSELVCGNKIVKIGANAFKNCDALTAITLPSSLEEIGDGAFENCDGITEIVIHDKVKILGKRAFWNCKALVKVTVGSGVKRIDDEAFAYGFIEELTLKRGIEEIGESVFYMCKMTTLNIPDSVKKIEKSAFQGCSRITTVEGCGGIVEIGESAFEGCTNLLTVSFGASLRKIDYHAFYNDKKLTRINYAGTDMQWKTQITRAAGWAQGTKNVKVYCLLGAVIDLF